MTNPASIAKEPIAPRIMLLGGRRVMLDADLAELYGVSTGALMQAVKRNLGRFPPDFMFQLTEQDLGNLKSQSVISSSTGGRLREMVAANADLAKKLDELERRVAGHDRAITTIVQAIRDLAAPAETRPKRRIGFVADD